MRQTKTWFAAALLCGAATAAQAQSNVTLYGRVVAGVDFVSNVQKEGGGSGTLWRGAGNQWGTSMFGLKGSEDLGGGLKGLFQLESGFDATKGRTNGSALFNRRAFIALQNNSWGTLTLGKNKFVADAVWALDPTGQQFISTATLVRGRNWGDIDNMIAYETPNFGGFSLQALTGLGEQAGSASKLRKDAILLTYTAPVFELRAIYDVVRDQNGKYSTLFDTSKELTVGGTVTIDKSSYTPATKTCPHPTPRPANPTRPTTTG
jgi:predicted porin